MTVRSKIEGVRLGRKCWGGSILFISLVLLFGSPAGTLYADIESDLVGYWPMEGDATDASGNGFDGTVVGNVEWVTGMFGGGLQLDGSSRVEVADFSLTTEEITFSAWINGWKVANWGGIVSSRFPTATEMIFGDNDTLHYVWNNNSNQTWGWAGGPSIPPDEWVMVALKVEPSGATAYVYSEAQGLQQGTNAIAHVEQPVGALNFGWVDCCGGGRYFRGIIDEVRVYTRALSEDDVIELVMGPVGAELAREPQPEHEATDVSRDATLAWQPGEFAVRHNVYFGTVLDDVNDADIDEPLDVLVSPAQVATSYDPGRLDFGQTYYWRVDEVNGAPDATVFKGANWSFATEPLSIPITQVTATTASSFGASVAENTVNGSGMTGDLHGSAAPDMWISAGIPATINYAFDRAYKLHEQWVWNSNQLIEAFVGFGAKDVVIEHSLDGENWTVLEGVGPLAPAPGIDGYAHNNTIDFGGAMAQHVRMTVNSAQGIAPQVSLSEVRFYYIPTFATRPDPASGATDVPPDTALSWGRNGREADHHEIYVGTDANDLPLAGGTNESSFSTADLDLQLGQTYSWRVDEVNDVMDPSIWTGDVWSFATVGALVIDDMEGYADEEFKEIWASWVDGFDDPANGSLVGNGAAGTPETDRVHGGNQSLPIRYDNSAAAQSEATRTFDAPMDWTGHGVKSLVIYFEGSSTNTGGNLYIKINDIKIAYDGDASSLMRLGWNKWVIPLAEVAGAALDRVTSLTVGIEGAGQGVLYVDDVTLVSEGRELITPAEPVEGLAVYLPLDGDFQDASGNARHGTAMGAPIFEAGASGQAVSLNGIDQYVEITGYQGVTAIDQVQQPFTISNWFKTFENGEMVTWGASPGGERLSWRIDGGSLRTEHGSGNLRGNTVANDGEWHHGALVVKEGAILRTTTTLLYIDGIEDSVFSGSDNPYNLQPDTNVRVGSRATSNDRFFPGAIDEVRIYDRALSAGEVAWLAGRSAAFDRP